MSILQMEKVSRRQTNSSNIAHPAIGRAGSQAKGVCAHNYCTSPPPEKGAITTHRALDTQHIPELESGGVQNSAAMIHVLFDSARSP